MGSAALPLGNGKGAVRVYLPLEPAQEGRTGVRCDLSRVALRMKRMGTETCPEGSY